MSTSELLRVHLHPGLKEVVQDLTARHGQSVAESVREAMSARARECLDMSEVTCQRVVVERRGRRGQGGRGHG